jgi:hypothetical protein
VPFVGMPPQIEALCIAPFGMEEGTEERLPDDEFGLIVGEPVRFRFFGSTVRRDDQVGVRLDYWGEDELDELDEIEVNLTAESRKAGEVSPDGRILSCEPDIPPEIGLVGASFGKGEGIDLLAVHPHHVVAVLAVVAKHQGVSESIFTTEMGSDEPHFRPLLQDQSSGSVSKEDTRISIPVIGNG